MRTVRFEVFEQAADQVRLRFWGEDGRLAGDRALPADEVERLVAEVEKGYGEAAPDLSRLGRRLYQWLDGPTERWLATARQGLPGLAVHVDVRGRLRHLPWELLAEDGAFLCGLPGAPLTPVRRVRTIKREVERENRPLRLLFMACSPLGVEPVLRFEEEEARILEATRRQQVELEVEESGSLQGLAERVEWVGAGFFDVCHLSGHAALTADGPRFVMEDEVGLRADASAEELVQAFGGAWPALVFLSGCETGRSGERGALPSFCEELVKAGAPAVLGWALPVLDVAANVVAAELYHHLAAGKRVDEAVALARAALFRERNPDWHLLRLYADATPLTPLVTPPGHRGRARLRLRPAHQVFLDARAKSEVCPRERFVGRRRALQRCLRVLRSVEGEEDHREGVILTGIGGLGKSSLAARLCERMSGWERLVWVGRVDEAELLRVLSDRLAERGVVEVLNDPGLSLRQRLRRLLEGPLASRPVLFVFDDFEQNVEKNAEGRPRLDEEGRGVLEPAALGILADLLAAVRESASASRVVVTCRYGIALPGPAGLHEEALESLRGADLEKKLGSLPRLARDGATDPALRERATGLAAGNPRLLERVNTVLEDEGTDHEAVLEALEGAADQFREETLLQVLLGLQAPEARRLVARAAVYRLPVDREAVAAAAGEVPLDPHLGRVAAVGLVESVVDPEAADGGRLFFVSEVLAPLLAGEMSGEERREVHRRAARDLYRRWWEEAERKTEERALEIHRLALAAGEKEIAVAIMDRVAWHWINRSRFREALLLAEATLELGEDFLVLHLLARAERHLGETGEAVEHYERALELCPPESDQTPKEILGERASIVHNLASLLAQQGQIDRAFQLWEQSLSLNETIGNVQGKAATLHAMASVLAQQGQIDRAFQLWEQSLSLEETIGNVQGKAATLAEMALAAGQQGDQERERRLNLEAVAALASIRAWADVVTVLNNLGASEAPDSLRLLAQAFWLAAHIPVPLEHTVDLAGKLLRKLGLEADAAPRVASAAVALTRERHRRFPQPEVILNEAFTLLAACAEARQVPEDQFQTWAQSLLSDLAPLFADLDRALQAIVGEDGWLFDRALVVSGREA